MRGTWPSTVIELVEMSVYGGAARPTPSLPLMAQTTPRLSPSAAMAAASLASKLVFFCIDVPEIRPRNVFVVSTHAIATPPDAVTPPGRACAALLEVRLNSDALRCCRWRRPCDP